ncbi:MAG: transposase [Gammaproteobacteria bacterium]|nr:transposase [Gammaproteobacteria bacterium]
MGIDEVITAPASPWQNACVERVIRTLRRELFYHVIVLNERHLKRLMSSYLDYYHPWRTDQSLNCDAPDGRPVRAAEPYNVVEFPAVHGLHHVYLPKAA